MEQDAQYFEESQEASGSLVEIKVSSDRGDTWQRRRVNMASDLDETGLLPGEIFQLHGVQYIVSNGDGGLRVERLKTPVTKKKTVNKFTN